MHQSLPKHHPAAHTCPIRALIQRIKHAQQYSHDTTQQLGTYFDNKGAKRILRPRTITNALRVAVKALNLESINIRASQVSSHSLRAGGATAMHINGVPDITIQKMGRWSSDTFLIYIRDQLFHFTNAVSSKMSNAFNMFTVDIPIQPLSNTS